jgi:hypothetical protein
MNIESGKYTVESFADKNDLTRASAINKLSKLKKEGYIQVSGGGKQKRIYKISNKKLRQPNGFFNVLNTYSPEKITPNFKHYIFGNYSVEKAIIDGLYLTKDIRIKNAMYSLFNHIKNWKKLFDLAKKHNLTKEVLKLYYEARQKVKVRKIPERYKNDKC